MQNSNRSRRLVAAAIVASATLSLSNLADAALSVKLENGGSIFTCADNAACDSANETGNLVLTNQAIGGYLFNLTIAISKPVTGTDVSPQIQLTDLSLTPFGSLSGPLMVSVSDTDFMGPGSPAPYQFAVAGTANSADVSFWAYTDTGNNLFGTGSLLSSLGPKSGPSFSDAAAISLHSSTAPYAITLAAQINPTSTGLSVTSISAQLTPVPLPAAGLLFGSGLIGLIGMVKRPRRAATGRDTG